MSANKAQRNTRSANRNRKRKEQRATGSGVYRERVVGGLREMILQWVSVGCPQDESMQQVLILAAIVGGILKANDFTGKISNDRVRDALALLGGYKPDRWLTIKEWWYAVMELDLEDVLLPDMTLPHNDDDALDETLASHANETFVFVTPKDVTTLQLQRTETLYRFTVLSHSPLPEVYVEPAETYSE